MSANRLATAASPYLRQHAANPVHWQPWDEIALDQARREDKPILLSIGYAACHWCHVMAHESFADESCAAVMNRLFVNIKVDREERPDLDHIYQSAHQLLTGRAGGWPLTVFLAPDGAPFFSGTYFPPQPRHGLPGFVDLCQRVAEVWQTRRADITAQNTQILRALNTTRPADSSAPAPDASARERATAALLARFDAEHGGIGNAPKFPQAPQLAFLLRQAGPAREAALFSLRQMAQGGIFDQIGGGFCRYSVDRRWEIPHFEKMLYDNALVLPLYATAFALTGEALFADTATATAGWMLGEMQAAVGGFYASIDADSEGVEGKFYLWQAAEARALLSAEEWAVAASCWGFDQAPNFEQRAWLPRRAKAPDADQAPLLSSARAKLLAARKLRSRPVRDDKILTAWNALAIAGLNQAARLLQQPQWCAAARRALDFVRAVAWRDGRLYAVATESAARLPAYLDDYAFLLYALLESLQTEWRAADLALSIELAEALLSDFVDDEAGGFFFTAADHEKLVQRPKIGVDAATPSGNGIAALSLLRLGHLLGERRYLTAAQRTLEAFATDLSHGAAASLLCALDEWQTPSTQIILRGPAQQVRDWQAQLARSARSVGLAHCPLIFALPNGAATPALAAYPDCVKATAWVCAGVQCSAPVDNLQALQRLLAQA